MLSKSQLKYIQSLGQKKFRDIESLFIAEGTKTVNELLTERPDLVQAVYALSEWIDAYKFDSPATEWIEISPVELERISQLTTPSNVLAVVKKIPAHDTGPVNNITLVLDAIRDPGNLGTLIRIADWYGIKQLVCSEDSADMYNPKVVQATMGSIARANVIYTDPADWLSRQQVKIFAAALDGKDVRKIATQEEAIIIIGNESKGISPGLMKLANEKITIPRPGKAESLNAAVAAGIILSHIVK